MAVRDKVEEKDQREAVPEPRRSSRGPASGWQGQRERDGICGLQGAQTEPAEGLGVDERKGTTRTQSGI